jgi:hypothetical protein
MPYDVPVFVFPIVLFEELIKDFFIYNRSLKVSKHLSHSTYSSRQLEAPQLLCDSSNCPPAAEWRTRGSCTQTTVAGQCPASSLRQFACLHAPHCSPPASRTRWSSLCAHSLCWTMSACSSSLGWSCRSLVLISLLRLRCHVWSPASTRWASRTQRVSLVLSFLFIVTLS